MLMLMLMLLGCCTSAANAPEASDCPRRPSEWPSLIGRYGG